MATAEKEITGTNHVSKDDIIFVLELFHENCWHAVWCDGRLRGCFQTETPDVMQKLKARKNWDTITVESFWSLLQDTLNAYRSDMWAERHKSYYPVRREELAKLLFEKNKK